MFCTAARSFQRLFSFLVSVSLQLQRRYRSGSPIPQRLTYLGLNWVGESVSETLGQELSAQNYIVFGRNSRAEALHRLIFASGRGFHQSQSYSPGTKPRRGLYLL